MIRVLLFSVVAVAIYMSVIYVVSLYKKDMSIIDIAYGPAFVVAALAQLMAMGAGGLHFFTLLVLVSIWALRLALQIGIRKIGKGEDYRYKDIKKKMGPNWKLKSYFSVFLFQGLLVLIIGSPVLITVINKTSQTGLLYYLGIMLFAWGFYWEAVSDIQKYRFKKRGEKGFIQSGLWQYSRHPNYFGEVCMWWAIGMIALEVPFGWAGLIGPVVITSLLLFVSGVPLLEKRYEKKPGFNEYKERTSIFIPWFPKKG